jgi:hypothetical protein
MMKLQRREKILAGVALGIVVLGGLWFLLFPGDNLSDDQLKKRQEELQAKIDDDKKLLDQADRDKVRLADWQQRALPADPVLASSLYKDWLRTLAESVKLKGFKVTATQPAAAREQSTRNQSAKITFTKITFTLHAQARLNSLVQFLYEFYSAGYLHQIRKLDIKRSRTSRDLDVEVVIEALSLPTAASKDKLPKITATPPVTLADYKPIVSRDFFADWVKPAPVVVERPRIRVDPPKPPPVDPAEHTFVIALIEVDGTPQVWLHNRLLDQLLKLGTGGKFTIGNKDGTVQSIHPDGEVVVEYGGKRRVLHIQEPLVPPKVSPTGPSRPSDTVFRRFRELAPAVATSAGPPKQPDTSPPRSPESASAAALPAGPPKQPDTASPRSPEPASAAATPAGPPKQPDAASPRPPEPASAVATPAGPPKQSDKVSDSTEPDPDDDN